MVSLEGLIASYLSLLPGTLWALVLTSYMQRCVYAVFGTQHFTDASTSGCVYKVCKPNVVKLQKQNKHAWFIFILIFCLEPTACMQVHCTMGALTVLSLVPRPSLCPDLIACSLHTANQSKLDSRKAWEWGYNSLTHCRCWRYQYFHSNCRCVFCGQWCCIVVPDMESISIV